MRWIAAALMLAGGCETAAPACAFDASRPVVEALASPVDAIAFETRPEGGRAWWSDTVGLHAIDLARGGAPRGRAAVVDARCDGGFAVTSSEDGGTDVACLRRSNDALARSGHAAWISFDRGLALRRVVELGPAGDDARSIAIARLPGRGLAIAWHDGQAPRAASWLARIDDDGGVLPDVTRLSREDANAGDVVLALDGASALVVHAETWTVPGGGTVGHLVASREGRRSKRVALLAHGAPRPAVLVDEHGFMLAFRDERPALGDPRIFVERVAEDLEVVGPRAPGSPSDGDASVALLACGDLRFTVVPRRGTNDEILALRRLDASGIPAPSDTMFQELHRDLRTFAVGCQGDRALLLYVRPPARRTEPPSLRAVPYGCGSRTK